MRRHLLYGRFGSIDKTRIAKARDEQATSLDLLSGDQLDHGLGHALNDLKSLNLSPTEIGVDLLVLAAHVHAADTRLSRTTESQDAWTREIRLVVPVSDLKRWNAVSHVLNRMLSFLTGDRWTIGFRSRPKRFSRLAPERQHPLLPVTFDGVSLFSGGADSLIGAIDSLHAGRTPLLISHAGEAIVSKSQDQCFDQLQAAYPSSDVDRLRVWMAFKSEMIDNVASEETTRGRSFLFFSIGIAAGTALEKPFELKVPENGLIALNVPLDKLRLGALSTRTTHPFYMARWNELTHALGIAGQIVNPYWDKTKGEMVKSCNNKALLKQILPLSLSCSSPSKARWKGEALGHCGYCLPCLIRRASLRGGDPTTYGIPDLTKSILDTRQAEGQQVRSFQYAISRLKKNPELSKLLIHKPGPLTDYPDRLDDYAGVYLRGMKEVGLLLKGVKASPK